MTIKVAVVTGASSGIGRACAIRLAEDSFALVLAGRRESELEITRNQCADPGNVLCVPCDVSDAGQANDLVARAVERFGRVDLLFNNAGVSAAAAPIEDVPDDSFEQVVAINSVGAFWVARAAYRQMKMQSPQGGRIINNGSISAHVPRPHGVAYNMTKHSISGLTKSISLEGRAHNIACGQIDIGNTATDMTEKMQRGMLQADGSIRPEPTFDVKHVADAVAYMAGLPLDANVLTITVMATAMPYVGRG